MINENDAKMLDALKKSVSELDGDETFTITARRCKRCGGLLTSAQAVKDGYGHVCKMKAEGERPDPNQIKMDI